MISVKKQIDLTGKSILIIAPHPDDESIGCGGILCLYPQQCTVVVLTDGCNGISDKSREETRKIRHEELVNVMQYTKVKEWLHLDFEDGQLMNCPSCMDSIDFKKFDVIFLPSPNDDHCDHAAAYKYAIIEIQKSEFQGDVFQYEVHLPFHEANTYIDITSVIGLKRELIAFHKSQSVYMDYTKKCTSLARFRASEENRHDRFYEAYKIVNMNAIGKYDEVTLQYETILSKVRLNRDVLLVWMEEEIADTNYLIKKLLVMGISQVSIYGFGQLGKLVYQQMKKNDFDVLEIIDKQKKVNDIGEHKIMNPEEGCRDVQLILVTAIYDYKTIFKELQELSYKNIASLVDLLHNNENLI